MRFSAACSVVVPLMLLVLGRSVLAQEIKFPIPLGDTHRAVGAAMMGPVMRTMFNGDRTGAMMFGMAVNPLFSTGFKQEFGVTDEQVKTLLQTLPKRIEDAGVKEIFIGLTKQFDENIDYQPTEEDEAALDAAFQSVFDGMNAVCDEVFTPEQMQKMNGMMFVLMGGLESPFLNEKSLDVLDLSDEQKEKVAAIRKEMEPEKEKFLGELETVMKKFVKEGKANLKDLEAAGEKVKDITEKVKKRVLEILTDEQKAKAAELAAHPPKFLNPTALNMIPDWMPGVGSWKPGDGAPETEKKERRKRKSFPTAEETETPK